MQGAASSKKFRFSLSHPQTTDGKERNKKGSETSLANQLFPMLLQRPSDRLIILPVRSPLGQNDDIDVPQKGQMPAEALPNQALDPIPGNSSFYVFLGDCKTQSGMPDRVGPHQYRKNPIRRFSRPGEHERIVGRVGQSTALGERVIAPLFTDYRHPGINNRTDLPARLSLSSVATAVEQPAKSIATSCPDPGRAFLVALNRQSSPSFRPTGVNHTPPGFSTHSRTKAMGSGPFDSARLKRSFHDLYPAKL